MNQIWYIVFRIKVISSFKGKLGYNKYISVFLIQVLLYAIPAYGQNLLNNSENHQAYSPLKVISENDKGMVLLYNSGNQDYMETSTGEGGFVRMMIQDHGTSSDPGKPQLPVLTRLLDYDKTGKAIIKIRKVFVTRKYLEDIGEYQMIFPSQPGQPKAEQPQDKPLIIDRSVYNSKQAYLTDTVSITRIGKMRGTSIGNLQINPVIYHPAKSYIDIIQSMTIEIEYRPEAGKPIDNKGVFSAPFEQVLSKGLINYDEDDVIPGFSLEPVGLVIISDTSLKEHLQPLIEWKTQKGYRISEIYIGENGIERNYDSIKDSLNYIYNNTDPENPAPSYLILAGDLDYIPDSEGSGSLSDMYYGEFDGEGDFIPDMFIGRLPARDTTELKSIVAKIIEYEKFLFGDTIKHFEKAVAATGVDAGNIAFMDGQINYAASYFNQNPYNTDPYVFNHETNDSIRSVRYDSLRVLMKEGVGFINYTGHGTATSWMSTGINYSFIDEMENSSRYPVIISNACLTGKFNDENCLGSSFVRAADKGALAFIGCTNDSYWDEDFYWSVGVGSISSNPEYSQTGLGFYDRLFHLNDESPSDWYTSLGQIMFAGNLAVSESTSLRKKYYWESYALLGDPSLIPYIGSPVTNETEIPDTVPPSLNKLNIITDPFSYIGISDFDSLLDASHATPSGSAYLNIPDIEKDSILIVLSMQNKIPLQKTIYFDESDTAWLSINDINVSDTDGNDNGQADYNETISLAADIQNAGNMVADDVYILISSSSEYLDITKDSLFIGTINGLTETIETGFDIGIADSIPDLEIAGIDIQLFYNDNTISRASDISLHAPELEISGSYINDTIDGNANGFAEPGERIKLVFEIINNGSSLCSGIINIDNISAYLDFDATMLVTGPLNPGEPALVEVNVDIDPAAPEATDLHFDVELSSSPYSVKKSLSIIAGTSTEDFETADFQRFPWSNMHNNPWTITDDYSYSNNFSARSGTISHNQESVLSLWLNIPEKDTIRFWYKVSSEYYNGDQYGDFLDFMADSTRLLHESGDIDWTYMVVPLEKGVHFLEWRYNKDGTVNTGEDAAYIDFVRFPALAFIEKAICLNKISSPEEGKNYDEEVLTVELTNLGLDTLSLISLTYLVNDETEVNENFNVDFKPGDTISISFTETIDMTQDTTYDIRVFVTYPDNYFINDTLKMTIVVTGINDININDGDFRIAPNPVGDHINILAGISSANNTITLYNSSGNIAYMKLMDHITAGERITLYPGQIAKGSYILEIQTEEKRYLYKVLKL